MHPHYEWACATLDGFDDGLVGPVDAKHVGGFEKREAIVSRYTAQLFWQMSVTGTTRSALSIIEGSKEPVVEVIEWDSDYAVELWDRAKAFMECVWSLVPPVALPAVAAPVAAIREVCMENHNEWAVHAGVFIETYAAAKKFEKANKGIKSLVPSDAAKCFGHGVIATRNRAGALYIRES